MLTNKIRFLFLTLFATLYSGAAFAGATKVNDLSQNVVSSTTFMPGMISALCYLLGLLLGITAILKIKDHVENPNQTPLRVGIIRLLVGGALFSLPVIANAAWHTFAWFGLDFFFYNTSLDASEYGSAVSKDGGGINEIFSNIMDSIDETPGIVTAISYLLGLILCVSGILKVREHVENPEQVTIKEAVARILTAGALFALPTIFNAAYYTILNDPSNAGLGGILGSLSFFASSQNSDISTCSALPAGASGLGYLACRLVDFTSYAPTFLEAISYLFGMVLAVWGILKIRDHVLNAGQTSIWDGVTRMLAAGAFFAMPYVSEVMRSTVADSGSSWFGFLTTANTGTKHGVPGACAGTGSLSLDTAMSCFMFDIMTPLHILLNFFAWVAGLVLIMVGISRLMKSAQDGARGPGGIGTLSTFLVGGILISYNAIVGAVTQSFFGAGPTKTNTNLSYTSGMSGDEVQHVEIVSTAILQFMIIVGLISFVRGWFIMRSVAEGNSQASLMAGTTHILAGALAINLGPLLNAVQTTLHVGSIGMTFS